MDNATNIVQGKHIDSLAAASKRYVLAEILDVTSAVTAALADLGVLTGVTLSTTQPTVNGALWYSVDDEPVLKLYHGGHNYTLVVPTNYTLTTANATIQFKGVSSNVRASDFSVSGNEITVEKGALISNGTPLVLLTEGYTLKLGDSVPAQQFNTGTISDDAVYTYGDLTEGFVLSGNQISYCSATTPALTLKNVATAPTVTGKVVALTTENFSGTTITVSQNADDFEFNLGAGDYTGKTFTGSAAADKITGMGTTQNINGGAGDDTLSGGSGKDTLRGGAGNDSLFGGAGNDSLVGDTGSDTLSGGAGDDTLSGGADNDVFIYKPGEGKDRIKDYSAGDMLQIIDGTFTSGTFKSGDLTLAISGGGYVIFKGVTASDKFNINGRIYVIDSNKLVEQS